MRWYARLTQELADALLDNPPDGRRTRLQQVSDSIDELRGGFQEQEGFIENELQRAAARVAGVEESISRVASTLIRVEGMTRALVRSRLRTGTRPPTLPQVPSDGGIQMATRGRGHRGGGGVGSSRAGRASGEHGYSF